MNVYPITREPGIFWNLFSDEFVGFAGSDGISSGIAVVLSEVRRMFIDIFGADTVNSHPVLGVLYSSGVPQTQRENALIFLASSGLYYLNHIYQFAHELCHFMVPGNVCPPYRWLEETLCQMMSWYVLQKLSETPAGAGVPQLASLYDRMLPYVEQSQRAHCEIGSGCSLSEYISANLSHLRRDPYDRDMNSAIALGIYPLFLDRPELWKIVPFLDKLRGDMRLPDAVNFACCAAGVPDIVRNELANRLCQ